MNLKIFNKWEKNFPQSGWSGLKQPTPSQIQNMQRITFLIIEKFKITPSAQLCWWMGGWGMPISELALTIIISITHPGSQAWLDVEWCHDQDNQSARGHKDIVQMPEGERRHRVGDPVPGELWGVEESLHDARLLQAEVHGSKDLLVWVRSEHPVAGSDTLGVEGKSVVQALALQHLVLTLKPVKAFVQVDLAVAGANDLKGCFSRGAWGDKKTNKIN